MAPAARRPETAPPAPRGRIRRAALVAAAFTASFVAAGSAFWGTALGTVSVFPRESFKGVLAFVALLAIQTVVPTLVAAGPLSLAPRLRRYGRAAAAAWGYGALCGLLFPGPTFAAVLAVFPDGRGRGFPAPGLEVLNPLLIVVCGVATGSLAGFVAVVCVALRYLALARSGPRPDADSAVVA